MKYIYQQKANQQIKWGSCYTSIDLRLVSTGHQQYDFDSVEWKRSHILLESTNYTWPFSMGLLRDTKNCGLRVRREGRERSFPATVD